MTVRYLRNHDATAREYIKEHRVETADAWNDLHTLLDAAHKCGYDDAAARYRQAGADLARDERDKAYTRGYNDGRAAAVAEMREAVKKT